MMFLAILLQYDSSYACKHRSLDTQVRIQTPFFSLSHKGNCWIGQVQYDREGTAVQKD